MPAKRTGSLNAKQKRLTDDMIQALQPAVYAVADLVKTDAQVSITNGAVSGKGHVPSAPGTPPNNDTGDLANGIIVERIGPLAARVVSTAAHGAIQELGGSTGKAVLPERPYMRPSAAKNREPGVKLMTVAVDRVLKGGKLV
jgi:hypothetical protein